jgi:SAM-dependent methyltransferase
MGTLSRWRSRLRRLFRPIPTPVPGEADPYVRELTPAEIAQGCHRDAVGGRWEEIGRLQLDFLIAQGLQPSDRLLDVGCGCLRAGLHFIRYLEPGHYFGIDRNASLLEAAGRVELARAGLADRRPHLLVNERFELGRFGQTFRFALANSVFTHLPLNAIERCLVNVGAVLEPGGRFFASYLEAPRPRYLDDLHHPDGIVSHSDRNPYHYHLSAFEHLAAGLPLRVERQPDWGHPRKLAMLIFTRLL